MHRLTDAGLRWAATARQPGGTRVIDDPLVRERLARVALDAEVSFLPGGPMSKILSAEALIRNTAELMDLFGPAGALPAGEDGAVCDGEVESLYRIAQGTAIYGGSVEIFRNMLAERILGLPRARMLPSSARSS